jgi:hypothetical protein
MAIELWSWVVLVIEGKHLIRTFDGRFVGWASEAEVVLTDENWTERTATLALGNISTGEIRKIY